MEKNISILVHATGHVATHDWSRHIQVRMAEKNNNDDIICHWLKKRWRWRRNGRDIYAREGGMVKASEKFVAGAHDIQIQTPVPGH